MIHHCRFVEQSKKMFHFSSTLRFTDHLQLVKVWPFKSRAYVSPPWFLSWSPCYTELHEELTSRVWWKLWCKTLWNWPFSFLSSFMLKYSLFLKPTLVFHSVSSSSIILLRCGCMYVTEGRLRSRGSCFALSYNAYSLC